MRWIRRAGDPRPREVSRRGAGLSEPPLVADLEARRHRAETAMAAARGDGAAPLDGPGSAKALEGEVAALAEVLRGVRAALARGSEPDGLPARVAAEVRLHWADELAAHERGGASEAWLTYDRGGVAALDSLLPRAPSTPVAHR